MTAEALASARFALHKAHAQRSKAGEELQKASEAVAAARALVASVQHDVEHHVEADRAISNNRAAGIKRAIRAGLAPVFDPAPELSKAAQLRLEAQARLAAATEALAELEADEQSAISVMTAAQDEVRAAAQAVALSIAHEMAEKAEALESRALELRVRLGGAMGAVGQFPVLTDSLRNVVSQTDDYFSDRLLRDGRLWNARKHADEVWRPFIGALIENPEALLDFDQPEGRKAAA